MGVLYILDEPSIGLHQRDNDKLLATLKRLRDLGNTLIVVEHDEDTMRAADYIVDIGPGAGVHGGEVVAAGHAWRISWPSQRAITGAVSERQKEDRRAGNAPRRGTASSSPCAGRTENNLKNIDVSIPLGDVYLRDRRLRQRAKARSSTRSSTKSLARTSTARRRTPGKHRAHRGRGESGQGHRHRPERPSGARRAPIPRPIPGSLTTSATCSPPRQDAEGAGLRPGPVLLQRPRRTVRGLRRRRSAQDRDALPAGRLRSLRGVQGQALQPRDAGGAL